MRRILSLLAVLVATIFLTGCPSINDTGLGSCFLGNTPSGCIGSPNLPPSYIENGGFGLYTEYRILDVDADFRADNIIGVFGIVAGSSGNTYGTATSFGPENSGPANVLPPATPNIATAFIGVPDGQVPALWLVTWGSSAQSEWADYLQTHFGPLMDLHGVQWPNFCNGNGLYIDIEAGDPTVVDRCTLTSCTCRIQTAGPTVSSPSSVTQPAAEEAGNPVDMTVTPARQMQGGFISSQIGVGIYDAYGNFVSCAGYNGGCGPALTITGPGNQSFLWPAWNLAWGDNNRPGDYYGQVQTLVNGQWQDWDSFGFSIINGGIPVFRFYSPSRGTHYFSSTFDGGSIWPYDYRYEGVGFHAYDHGVAFQPFGNASTLYKLSCCYGGGNGSWLLTDNQTEITNAENAGWIPGGIIGDVMSYQYQNCNVSPCFTPNIPLYRTWWQTNGNANFFYTTSYTEYLSVLHNGGHSQGIQGYVPVGP